MPRKKKEEKILSNSELIKMELASANARERKLQLKLARVELDKAKKEANLLSANFTLKNKEIEERGLKLIELEKQNAKKLLEHKEFVEEIKERLELKEEWGYDPDTGEIKE